MRGPITSDIILARTPIVTLVLGRIPIWILDGHHVVQTTRTRGQPDWLGLRQWHSNRVPMNKRSHNRDKLLELLGKILAEHHFVCEAILYDECIRGQSLIWDLPLHL